MHETIVAESLGKQFPGGVEAVRDVSFTVASSEIYGFLGPNGAGKTTTTSILTTLLRPTRGRAEVAGFDVSDRPEAVRRRIGLVFQKSTADGDLTGRENLEIAAGLCGISRIDARPRIRDLLERMDLTNVADRLVRTYSGGMQRRLEVAVGTIQEPEVLFLDEPTLGLDPQGRAGFWKYIRDLRADDHVTISLSTHYLDEADQLCDRLSVIDRGAVVASGTPGELKERIGGDTVEVTTAGDSADISGALAAVPGILSVTRTGRFYRLKCQKGETLVAKVALAIPPTGAEVLSLVVRKPSLDDVFLEMTGRAYREDEEPNGSRNDRPHPPGRDG